jgi:hypothetical protein
MAFSIGGGITIGGGISLTPIQASSSNFSFFNSIAVIGDGTASAAYSAIAVSTSGRFVAVGIDQSVAFTARITFATSVNGTTWTNPAQIPIPQAAGYLTSIAVNTSGRFVALGTGSDGIGGSNYTLATTSTNGTTWSSATYITSAGISLSSIAVSSSNLFVAVGSDAVGLPVYSTSTNGTTWTTNIMNGSSTIAYMGPLAVNSSGLFVALGQDSTSALIYATSTNGTTWTTPAPFNGVSTPFNGGIISMTVSPSGKFVVVGFFNDGIKDVPIYATSDNGTTWSSATSLGSYSGSYRLNSITVNSSGLFVAVGNESAVGGAIYTTSTNGTTWSAPALLSGTDISDSLNGIAVNTSTGKFVAVGGGGTGSQPIYTD